MYAIKQIKICAEYRDMLPRPRLDLSGTPGLRPIGLSPGSWQTSLGLGSMSRYSAQILICISHYSDVIMSGMASQINSVSIVYSTVCSGADQRKHQSSASLAFVRGIHRWQRTSNAENVSIWWRRYAFNVDSDHIDDFSARLHALAMEILRYWTKPSILFPMEQTLNSTMKYLLRKMTSHCYLQATVKSSCYDHPSDSDAGGIPPSIKHGDELCARNLFMLVFLVE